MHIVNEAMHIVNKLMYIVYKACILWKKSCVQFLTHAYRCNRFIVFSKTQGQKCGQKQYNTNSDIQHEHPGNRIYIFYT